ncbi:patatin-like phospholipase family protein [Azomonas macrocytogenes]|uniref:NTE family protein n=1 Tax=Azomonas macrocytogenes TaxID=69962 RepID=A0A839T804_AZOMA|nr:patatin-like phospholipase family protein [Azomonas macrocytogenes]MBB3104596.1 NTE family protein [Azomonas macrocytogenes]
MGKKVALVLGSGGARGYAHIGVIEEIESRGYQIGCIAGCSIGAVIGGIHAAGKLAVYREWVTKLDYLDVMRLLDVSFSLGAIRGEKVFNRIREIVGEVDIQNLPIPFTAVATDLTNHQEMWFQEGCLHQAMRASAAIPSLFTPVILGKRVLVDGGLLNPLPIVPVVSSHCDMIVAVNLCASDNPHYSLPVIERPGMLAKGRFDQLMGSLSSHLTFWRKESKDEEELTEAFDVSTRTQTATAREARGTPKSAEGSQVIDVTGPASMLELINQSLEVMQDSLTQYKIAGYPPDVLINIPRRACRFFEFYKALELIELGRIIARDTLDRYEEEHGYP